MTATTLAAATADATTHEENPWARAWRRLKRRKGAMAGLFVVVLFIVLAGFAPLIAPYDPTATRFTQVRKAPSWAHWLRTDEGGRDIPNRIIFGPRPPPNPGL